MINRRSIRIKVMQVFYAAQMADVTNSKEALQMLDDSIENTIRLNLLILQYFKRIIQYVNIHAEQGRSKMLQIPKPIDLDTRIAKSDIIKYIEESVTFNKLCKQYKVIDLIDDSVIKDCFYALFKSAQYEAFSAKEEVTLDDEKELFIFFLKNIFFASPELMLAIEAELPCILDDDELIFSSLKRSIKHFNSTEKVNFELGFDAWQKEKEYAYDLLKVTIDKSAEYDAIIEPKLSGWELDRISKIDLVIVKLALSELLHFPTIPTKVTINEFIDLTKMYSTQKSKEFVNGILDRITKELTAQNKILKSGRGLIDL